MTWLRFPAKALRAQVIARHIRRCGLRGAVVFSCGNASRALRKMDLYVVDISRTGDLEPGRWWDAAEIRRAWPDLFDATSGHLPAPVMAEIAREFREALGDLPEPAYRVPTGSGETVVCLAMAYPQIRWTAVYNLNEATAYHPEAPLNDLVRALCKVEGLE